MTSYPGFTGERKLVIKKKKYLNGSETIFNKMLGQNIIAYVKLSSKTPRIILYSLHQKPVYVKCHCTVKYGPLHFMMLNYLL